MTSVRSDSFLDSIDWVVRAPCCGRGSILTIGPDLGGPGGEGPHPLEPTLVLAPNFDSWIERLTRFRGIEYGLVPGEIGELPRKEHAEQRAYFRRLNPGIDWNPR